MPSYRDKVVEFDNGVKVLNCTPHEIAFHSEYTGNDIRVERCGATLTSDIVDQEPIKGPSQDAEYVRVRAFPTPKGLSEIKAIREELGSQVILIGSILSTLAYPEVYSMVPLEGGFRMSSEGNKLMKMGKFSKFFQGSEMLSAEDKVGSMLKGLAELKNKITAAIHYGLETDPTKRKLPLAKLVAHLDRLEGLHDAMVKMLGDKIAIYEDIRKELKDIV